MAENLRNEGLDDIIVVINNIEAAIARVTILLELEASRNKRKSESRHPVSAAAENSKLNQNNTGGPMFFLGKRKRTNSREIFVEKVKQLKYGEIRYEKRRR